MKLHHLLQKCSFFLIKLAVFQASGAAYMKLHGMMIDEWWMSLRSALFKTREPQNFEY